uniref:Hydroxysteroid 17-beta dehydrogenase 8 n=1 Tax=Gorilla gorilla gorilla TaxID=9595 RepID=A0A2I2YQA7_GORGO
MHKAGLLGHCARARKSVRMASSGMTRRDPLTNKVALVTASTDGLGEPEDCAGIVSFLCSEDASYITGETMVVGGGTPSRL